MAVLAQHWPSTKTYRDDPVEPRETKKTTPILPAAFFPGSTGVIYRQFSITIVSAMLLSVLVGLIFTPALCATLLKPVEKGHQQKNAGFFGYFNRGFRRTNKVYESGVKHLLGKTLSGAILSSPAIVAHPSLV